jgi:hypothetical protein
MQAEGRKITLRRASEPVHNGAARLGHITGPVYVNGNDAIQYSNGKPFKIGKLVKSVSPTKRAELEIERAELSRKNPGKEYMIGETYDPFPSTGGVMLSTSGQHGFSRGLATQLHLVEMNGKEKGKTGEFGKEKPV